MLFSFPDNLNENRPLRRTVELAKENILCITFYDFSITYYQMTVVACNMSLQVAGWIAGCTSIIMKHSCVGIRPILRNQTGQKILDIAFQAFQ